ncbi:ImmA/IrrE family metallo-endopeptidase [Nocardiopsis mangrovi]|uniref:ImmA/IrrE family metallo-endopeptidase n=1 Tax=Nocardiopsis mangrovi TaxID=1179818 RepID=A0ABV9E0Y6_9ACTN
MSRYENGLNHPTEAVSFGAKTKTSARKQKAVRAQAAIALHLHAWLEEKFTLPVPDVPTFSRPEPETAAEMVRSCWGLGEAPAPNMVHLLEAHGVRVFALDPAHAEVDAFSFWRDDTPFVFLNTAKSGERGRFDGAHELGHLVLHGHDRSLTGPEAEREANQFASAFLMPRADVQARVPAGVTADQILKAKRFWRVSAMALAYRLHDLGLLSDWQHRAACKELAELGFRSGEPGGIPRETSQVLAKVSARLRESGRPLARLAVELGLPSDELNSLMFGLAFTLNHGQGSGGPAAPPRLHLV